MFDDFCLLVLVASLLFRVCVCVRCDVCLGNFVVQALMLLMDERAELLTLATNHLQQCVKSPELLSHGPSFCLLVHAFPFRICCRDLKHKSPFIVGLALTVLGNICSVRLLCCCAAVFPWIHSC